MSIVTVHGPYMMYGAGGGIVANDPTGVIKTTPVPGNSLQFTFSVGATSRPGTDITWTWSPAAGSAPASGATGASVTVTFPPNQTTVVTCTVAGAGTPPPTNGVRQCTVRTGASATPRMAEAAVEDAGMGGTDVQQAASSLYDPSHHSVTEVMTYVQEHPDEAGAIYDAEDAGRQRSTLLAHLAELIPFDPGDYTVADVTQYAEEHPDEVADILACLLYTSDAADE